MATSFKKTRVCVPASRLVEKQTRDNLYWKNYEFPVTKKEFGSVTCVDFSPVAPYHYAVASSTKVQIYNPHLHDLEKRLSTFKKEVRCCRYRSDGRLLVAGGEEGVVKVFEVSGKSLLRTFRGHKGIVHYACFTPNNVQVLSCGDDGVNLWDLGGSSLVRTFGEHTDYVRCGSCPSSAPALFLSGSYDRSAKLYDTRAPRSVLTVQHDSPVEDVLMFPGGTVFLTAGGNGVKVWDVTRGGQLLAELNNHHKTVTCLAFASDHQRLLSGSLDNNVKVYDISTYQPVHTMNFPAPILSLSVSKEDKMLAVAMSNGLLSVQKQKPPQQPAQAYRPQRSRKLNLKNKYYKPSTNSVVIERGTREVMAKYDKYFKKFEHSKALDAALEVNIRQRAPEVTVSVMQELIRRDSLRQALAGRDEKALIILLRFFVKNIGRPQFMTTLTDVFNVILDLYSSSLGQSLAVDNLFKKIKKIIDWEVKCMMGMLQTIGSMDTLFALSSREPATQTSISNDII